MVVLSFICGAVFGGNPNNAGIVAYVITILFAIGCMGVYIINSNKCNIFVVGQFVCMIIAIFTSYIIGGAYVL